MDRSTGGWALAEAFVRIQPDTEGFREKADAELKRQMAGDKVGVPVDADTDAAKRKMAELEAILAVIAKRVTSAKIVADDAGVQAELAKITAWLRALDRQVAKPEVNLEGVARMESVMKSISAQMDRMSGRVVRSHIGIDDADAERKLALLLTQLYEMQTRLTDLHIEVDDPGALAKIAALRAALASLHDQVLSMSMTEAIGVPDSGAISQSLSTVKRVLAELGIADIADVNVPASKIMAQLTRLKLMIQRTPGPGLPGLADLMDLNVPPAVIAAQLQRLRAAVQKAQGGGAQITDILNINATTEQAQRAIAQIQDAFNAIPDTQVTDIAATIDPATLARITELRTALASIVAPADFARSVNLIQGELDSLRVPALEAGVNLGVWDATVSHIQKILDTLHIRALSADFDQGALARMIDLIQGELDTLRIRALKVGVDQTQVDASVAYIQAKLDAISLPMLRGGGISTVDVGAAELAYAALDEEIRKLVTDLAGAGAAATAASGPMSTLDFDIVGLGDAAGAAARDLAAAALSADSVTAAMLTLQRALDEDATTLAGLKSTLNAAVDAARRQRNATGELADMTVIAAAKEELLSRALNDANVSLAQQRTAIAAVTAAEREMNLQAAAAAAGGGAAFGGAPPEPPPSGGGAGGAAAAGGFLGGLAGTQVAAALLGIHVAADLVIESLIAIVGAAAAAATGLAALVPIANDIKNHIQAVNTVNSALGDQIPVIGGNFRSFAESTHMASAGLEIYGAAVNAVSGKTNALTQSAQRVVTMFENWAANISNWAQHSTTLNTILQQGAGYLAQFGHILGQFGLAIDNILKADPGIVHYFLDFIGGIASLFNWLTKLPSPVLRTILLLHGFYLAAKLLDGGLGQLIGLIPGFGKLGDAISKSVSIAGLGRLIGLVPGLRGVGAALEGLKVSPAVLFSWVGVAAALAAGFGLLIYKATQADAATQAFSQHWIDWVNSLPASQAMTQGIAMAIGQLNARIAATPALVAAQTALAPGWHTNFAGGFALLGAQITSAAAKMGRAIVSVPESLASWGNMGRTLGLFGASFKDLVTNSGAQASITAHDIDNLRNAISKLLVEQSNLNTITGQLMSGTLAGVKGTFTFAQALGVLDLAGVQAGDKLQLMQEKVQNLITGYKQMSIQGDILANSVNAVTFAAELQQSKVGQLNQAWDTFFTFISGGLSGFLGFEQALKTLDASAGVSTAGLHLMSNAAITNGQNFIAAAQAANTQIDALTTMTAAANLGAHGTDLLSSASKDLVATMLPAARGSMTLTTILYDLAQRGGYKGADSFSQLSKWVGTASGTVGAMGKAGGPVTQLQGTVTTLTAKVGNLNTDVQNLATALKLDLTNAMAQAALAASGANKGFADFATAVDTTKFNSKQETAAALELGNQLVKLTGSTKDAKNIFMNFATTALHLSAQQADQLWNEIAGKLTPGVKDAGNKAQTAGGQVSNILTPALKDAGSKAVAAAGQINQNFIQSLQQIGFTISGQTHRDLSTFANDILATGTQSDQTRSARQRLINDLIAIGVQSSVARQLVNNLQGQINNMRGKNVMVTVQGQGSGTLYFNASTGVGGSIKGGLKFMAAGGRLPGFGGGDVIPALLEPGETVITKDMTKQYAQLFRKMGVKGFQAGGSTAAGFAGFPGRASRAMAGAVDWESGIEAGWMATVERNWANKAIAEWKAAVSKAAAAKAAAARAAGGGISTPVSGLSLSLVPYFQTAMRLTGVPSSWLADLETIAAYESGFNPNAINLTDINAQQGDPSRGLMQTIMTTFLAYHQPGTSMNIYDPVANIAAAINYIKARYGSVFNVPGIVSLSRGGGSVGYRGGGLVKMGDGGFLGAAYLAPQSVKLDSGGWLPPGRSMVYNGTGGWERLSRSGDGGGTTITLEVAGSAAGTSTFDEFLLRWLKEHVRVRGGGSVQTAFGRRS